MQNSDGGWPAFEPNKTNELLTLFPINGAEAAAIDPSTPDLTGRALEFLGEYAGLKKNRRGIKKGIDWLKKAQEIDGSWYGRWGVCYIYGTWAAVTGMRAVGVPGDDRHLILAKQWLEKVQHRDGGWGESCLSDQVKHYIPLSKPTLCQTAWALDALISLEEGPTPVIDTGMQTLLDLLEEKDDYPTGAGLPGNLYIHYHSYQWIWPMVTISHYLKKYG
ncbi:squalene cyclase [Rossellomorea marisflavi]